MKIKELPPELRPREKALHHGIENLTDEELLTLIIGSGVKGCSALDISRNLLGTYLSLSSLANTNFSSLEEHFGLSKNTALRLLATFEFHNRLNSPFYQHHYSINSAEDIYMRYRYLENYSQEVLAIVMFNRKRVIIKEKILYKGTNENVNISVKEIYTELIMSRCSSYALIHNHPDGTSEPSEDDVFFTNLIEETCNNLNIKLYDHIIIYPGGYYSFAQNSFTI